MIGPRIGNEGQRDLKDFRNLESIRDEFGRSTGRTSPTTGVMENPVAVK